MDACHMLRLYGPGCVLIAIWVICLRFVLAEKRFLCVISYRVSAVFQVGDLGMYV